MTWGHSHVTRNVVYSDLPRHDMSIKENKWEMWFYSYWVLIFHSCIKLLYTHKDVLVIT